MKELTIRTPAKINIGLNIISKRRDGYHNLETIFYPINLWDELTVKEDTKFELITNNSQLNIEHNNTIIKAWELINKLTDTELKALVTLKKRIPIGAGMGGGSSDGAAALILFNKFLGLKLSNEILYSLALEIGSDAPFFIEPKPKFGLSRGEIFESISLTIGKPILIVNPGINISTSWAFSKITPRIPETHLNQIEFEGQDNLSRFTNTIVNDFEPVVFESYPEIRAIKNRLYNLGAEYSLMTGSGSTVFGIFPNLSSAQNASKEFPKNYFTFINI
jgi:4-diphosphocytidyl-2-C-methyl-D-erythritol kinase